MTDKKHPPREAVRAIRLQFGDEEPIEVPVVETGTPMVEVAPGTFARAIGRRPDPDAEAVSPAEARRVEFWSEFERARADHETGRADNIAAQEHARRASGAVAAGESRRAGNKERDALIADIAEAARGKPAHTRVAFIESVLDQGGYHVAPDTIRRVLKRDRPELLTTPAEPGLARWSGERDNFIGRAQKLAARKSAEKEKDATA